jgi:hypothetical protein
MGARWEEIDLDGKTWTVPAARIKPGKETLDVGSSCTMVGPDNPLAVG